jgi:hypothetical protein
MPDFPKGILIVFISVFSLHFGKKRHASSCLFRILPDFLNGALINDVTMVPVVQQAVNLPKDWSNHLLASLKLYHKYAQMQSLNWNFSLSHNFKGPCLCI